MNNPNLQFGLGNLVNQNVWGPICANGSGGIVGVNDPTCVTRESQELQANSAQDWRITSKSPTNPSGAVTAYPDAGTYAYTGVLDDYTSLTSTYSLTMPINSTTRAWAMQDDWLAAPGLFDGSFTYEVAIQYDFAQPNNCPSTWSTGNWGVVASNVMIDGTAWHVCDGQVAHNSDGTCPTSGCGEIVFKLGATEATKPVLTSTSGTIDNRAIFQWLENNDVPGTSYPYVTPGSSLSALSAGWEIASTGGVPETFTNNGFTIHAVGAPAAPSSPPTGITFTPSGSSCVLSWSSTAAATHGYDGYYYVSSGGSGGGNFFVAAPSTTKTITGTPGEVVNAEMAVSNSGGQGPWAPYASCTIP